MLRDYLTKQFAQLAQIMAKLMKMREREEPLIIMQYINEHIDKELYKELLENNSLYANSKWSEPIQHLIKLLYYKIEAKQQLRENAQSEKESFLKIAQQFITANSTVYYMEIERMMENVKVK